MVTIVTMFFFCFICSKTMVNVPVGTDATYARLCDFALKKKMDINICPTLNVLFSPCLAQSFSN